MEEQTLKDKLKKRHLVYLYGTASGSGIQPHRIWAIEIDPLYPWAGGFTTRKENASAFTVALARVINKRLKEHGMTPWHQEVAPKEHEGPIYFLDHEITKR